MVRGHFAQVIPPPPTGSSARPLELSSCYNVCDVNGQYTVISYTVRQPKNRLTCSSSFRPCEGTESLVRVAKIPTRTSYDSVGHDSFFLILLFA